MDEPRPDLEKSNIPAPVRLAHSVVDKMHLTDPNEIADLKKRAGALAIQMSKRGEEVTEKTLLSALQNPATLKTQPAAKPSLFDQYDEMAASLPEPDRDVYEKIWHDTLQGSVATLQRIQPQNDPEDFEAYIEHYIKGLGEKLARNACESGSIEALRFIKQYGFDFSVRSAQKAPPKYLAEDKNYPRIAAREGHVHVLAFLKESGVDIIQKKEGSSEILCTALESGQPSCADYLLENGAKLGRLHDLRIEKMSMVAAKKGHLQTLVFLKERGLDIAQNHQYGDSIALRYALEKGHLPCARYLIKCGAVLCHSTAHDLFHKSIAQEDKEAIKLTYELANRYRRNNPLDDYIRRDWEKAEHLYNLGLEPKPEDKEALDKYLAASKAWQQMHHMPPPRYIEYHDPAGVSPKVLVTVARILMEKEHMREDTAKEIAYNTSLLFRSEDQLTQYFKKWARQAKLPLHDILYQINVPEDGRKNIDFKSWGDATLKHGPEMAKLIKFSDKIPAPLKTDDGSTWSLAKTREAISQYAYTRAEENPEIAKAFFIHNMTEDDFEKALEFDRMRKQNNIRSNLPKVTLGGAAFGMEGATFKRLDDGDPRGLVLGELTDCCQSIGNHGHDCAVHGFTAENGGFYAVAVNDNKGGEEIIGQAWAWRGKKDELVLDTLETLGGRVNPEQWANVLQAFARHLEENAADITALMVGTGGDTPESLPFNKAAAAAKPKDDYSGYRESSQQLQVWKRRRSPPHKG